MDRVYKEERNHILGMVKKIKASGCNVLLIQKSILRDAVTDLSLHYLVCARHGHDGARFAALHARCAAACRRISLLHEGTACPVCCHARWRDCSAAKPCMCPLACPPPQAKAKIMVVRDIERDDIEFISKALGCLPIAHVDHMRPEKLGAAELVEEVEVSRHEEGKRERETEQERVRHDDWLSVHAAWLSCVCVCAVCMFCAGVSQRTHDEHHGPACLAASRASQRRVRV